jgi:C4-dicarboxylate transporter DctM subunit
MTFTLALLPVGLLLLGAPIFVVFLAGAVATLVFVLPIPPIVLQQVMFGSLSSYALLAVPFFILAGELIQRSGIAGRLIVFVQSLIGHVPGSLGLTVLGTGTVLGAVSGSSPATVAAVGKSLYGGLLGAGYSRRNAAGLIASSASIAIVIPPSIAMILYGAAAEESVQKLFIAGILPGLFIAVLMGVAVVWHARRSGGDRAGGRFSAAAALTATVRAAGALLMPVLVLGGVFLGWFSPTEAGGFACAYAIVVGAFVYRTLGWRQILEASVEAAALTAQVLIIVAAAGLFSYILTTQQVPQLITAFVSDLGLTPVGFLIAVNILLLVVGCLLDPTSAILVLTPLLIPIVRALGIDPIHFGVIMTVNLSIGMFTPPFGLNVFVAQSLFKLPLQEIYAGVLPYAAVQIVALAVITYWPALSLALTGLVS